MNDSQTLFVFLLLLNSTIACRNTIHEHNYMRARASRGVKIIKVNKTAEKRNSVIWVFGANARRKEEQ